MVCAICRSPFTPGVFVYLYSQPNPCTYLQSDLNAHSSDNLKCFQIVLQCHSCIRCAFCKIIEEYGKRSQDEHTVIGGACFESTQVMEFVYLFY